MMKCLCVVFLVVLVDLSLAADPDNCPSGEYYPGPNCLENGTEPTCAPRSSHFIPKHTCDCWCLPGYYRNIDMNTCVASNEC